MEKYDLANKDELEKLLEELSEPIRQKISEVEKMEAEFIKDTETPKDFKIYNLNILEQISYIKKHTNFFNDIRLKNIIQIKVDFWDNVYMLADNGKFYINGIFNASQVNEIVLLDGFHLYKITNDNKIFPLKELEEWDNIDFYLYNAFNSYKKILTSDFYITGLTEDNNIISVHIDVNLTGIEPNNFINVDDILKIDEDVYIIKNGETKPLYIW